jgi:cysteine synthase A
VPPGSARIVAKLEWANPTGSMKDRMAKAAIERAEANGRLRPEISLRPGHWYCDQLNNHDAIEGYLPLGDELWQQTGGQVDAFVHSVSTAHSIHGVTRSLLKHNDRIRTIAVEPEESAVAADSGR